MYVKNFIPLLNEIREEIGRIKSRPISWIGRINYCKMVILPKITYKFQMMPISLPGILFTALKKQIMNLIWRNKKHRIAFQTLRQPKIKGGLAVPDIKTDYEAVVLSRVVEWARASKEKRWVNIENEMSKAISIRLFGTHLNIGHWIRIHMRSLKMH